ncbi:unnamed protein product [Cyprideis torosa]|uniref:Dolichyl-diphosphooligosaccharide--protein glycosyltransferase 48 kDa subunit n=1 Tax=Cyprideis torosa TaxID=163714 RepID=A0A7R8WHL9_9CRUS|nr:unnamed protein product [Cyprideis torosa]CAG0894334.1 unnamed protein product [Cyprideis torosa]
MKLSLFSLLFVLCASSFSNSSVPPKRVLVLLDTLATRETHSIFFKGLQERGFFLTYKSADDPGLQLIRYGEFMYDHLIIFAPAVEEFGGSLSVDIITKFVDGGGNVLMAGNSATSDLIREIATEVGVEMDEEGAAVIDHLHYDTADKGQHTLIVGDPSNLIQNAEKIVGSYQHSPFLYRGTGLIADRENPLVLPILTASPSAYSYDPEKPITDYPHAVGSNTVLIAGIQARNDARVVISGSLDFFSDEFFESAVSDVVDVRKKAPKSGNKDLAMALAGWVFKEQGVLRAVKVRHHLVSDESRPEAYTIKDDIVYEIEIEEMKHGEWVPFEANDVQVEFVRIDPFIRQTMKMVKKGLFQAKFRIPDVYGVFQFKVDYKKLGYSFLKSYTQVSVRPLEHTQYERFILSAYPYYISSFSMMFGVWCLSCVFLHHRDQVKDKTE